MSQKLSCLQALVVLFGLAILPSQEASAEQGCSRLRAWAEQNTAFLPRAYDSFSEYPTRYRRAIFSTVEPEMKSRLWRAHLEHYLDTHPSLTTQQEDVLRSAIDLVDAAFFDIGNDDPRWSDLVGAPINDLMRRARPLFSAKEMRQIFEQLGGPEKRGTREKVVLPLEPESGTEGIQCSCSTQSDYCSGSYNCSSSWAANCVSEASGCGTFWQYGCNGLCYDTTQ